MLLAFRIWMKFFWDLVVKLNCGSFKDRGLWLTLLVCFRPGLDLPVKLCSKEWATVRIFSIFRLSIVRREWVCFYGSLVCSFSSLRADADGHWLSVLFISSLGLRRFILSDTDRFFFWLVKTGTNPLTDWLVCVFLGMIVLYFSLGFSIISEGWDEMA